MISFDELRNHIGEKVICYGYYTGNWYYVSYNNKNGYCYKNYLK